MGSPLYDLTADCADLPEFLPAEGDGPVVELPEVDPETIIAAVAARQAQGGVLQEKVDGCWCAMTVDERGRLRNPLSRAGLRLRFAADWVGVHVDPQFVGWTIVGELEAGTTRARRRRETRESRGWYGLPIFHVYAMVDPAGAMHGPELAGQVAPLELAGRLRPVRQALPGQSWADFARRVFDEGGEGVVIRQGGACWRAKPLVTFDRYVMGIASEPDSKGRVCHKAILGVCTSAGARPRYQRLQVVELPRGVRWQDVKGLVVSVAGAAVDRESGVIRHARIVEVREDKAGWECRHYRRGAKAAI